MTSKGLKVNNILREGSFGLETWGTPPRPPYVFSLTRLSRGEDHEGPVTLKHDVIACCHSAEQHRNPLGVIDVVKRRLPQELTPGQSIGGVATRFHNTIMH